MTRAIETNFARFGPHRHLGIGRQWHEPYHEVGPIEPTPAEGLWRAKGVVMAVAAVILIWGF